MKCTNKVAAALIALLVGGHVAVAAELSLDRYLALSIQRLELAERSWSAKGRPPSRSAMTGLFARYGTSESEYIAYTSANREAIEAHLGEHPERKRRIVELSARIAEAIKDQPKKGGQRQ